MKLHLLGIPHTYTHPSFSCCAFTGKVLRFSPMMRSVGYHVIHYGNAGSVSGANEQVEILGSSEYERLGGCEPGGEQYGAKANVASPLYAAFNSRLAVELNERVEPGDIICLPFGTAHMPALNGEKTKTAFFVETGIGYTRAFAPFRIYESNAWMNIHMGRDQEGVIMGNDYWFTIPNYYDPNDWPLGVRPSATKPTIVFMGRLNEDKGLRVIRAIAKCMPDVTFKICGQGDPTPWLADNVIAVPPFHGKPREGRAAYLGLAHAVIVPTRYVEPFGGVAAEALLCGTPVLTSPFGAFAEYVDDGINGYMCRTLAQWMVAIDKVISGGSLDSRGGIQEVARERFSMWDLAFDYDDAFRQIGDLRKLGWYEINEKTKAAAQKDADEARCGCDEAHAHQEAE